MLPSSPKQRVDVDVRLELRHTDLQKCNGARSSQGERQKSSTSTLTFDPDHSATTELRLAVSSFVNGFPMLVDALHKAPPAIASIHLPAFEISCANKFMVHSESHEGRGVEHQRHKQNMNTQPHGDDLVEIVPCTRPFPIFSRQVQLPSQSLPVQRVVNQSDGNTQSQRKFYRNGRDSPYLQATHVRISVSNPQLLGNNMVEMGGPSGTELHSGSHTQLKSRNCSNRGVPFMRADIHIHMYHGRSSDDLDPLPSPLDQLAAANPLPCGTDDSLWHALAFGPAHKQTLFQYVRTRRLLSLRNVDRCIIPSSGFVLVYGPPGTGKTTLCRALATHFAIRQSLQGVFLHVRMDKLVSKWLGESAKLMAALFESVIETAASHDIVFLLLDEVESVARARVNAQASSYSSGDEVRVVNAFLTALDITANCPNVIIMATSNLPEDVDNAVVDRADLRLHIDIPNVSIIRHLILECLNHLIQAGIVTVENDVESRLLVCDSNTAMNGHTTPAWLDEVCVQLEGLSARQLRKLSIVALSLGESIDDHRGMKLGDFVHNLMHARCLSAVQEDHSSVK